MGTSGSFRTGPIEERGTRDFTDQRADPFHKSLGNLEASVTFASTTAAVLWKGNTILPGQLQESFNFEIELSGLVSSDGGDDLTLDLVTIEPDGTVTALATLVTVSLANAADKPFFCKFVGRVTLRQIGAVDGKIFAVGILEVGQATQLVFMGASAVAGVAVTLSSGVQLGVRADWDDVSGGTMTLVSAKASGSNIPGGFGG